MEEYEIRIHPSRIDGMMVSLAQIIKGDGDNIMVALLMTHFFIKSVYNKKEGKYIEDEAIAGKYILSRLKKDGPEALVKEAVRQIDLIKGE